MDAKGRQSSAGKFFGRRLHKDKEPKGSDSKHAASSSIDSPPGSSYGSQSSRHSHRHSIGGASIEQRPVSMTAEGIFARAGPVSSIDSPRDDNAKSGDPLPHHLNKGGGDFHQYPVFNPSQMPPNGYSNQGPPRPPPHSQGTTIASSNPGDRGVSMQQWGTRASSRDGTHPHYPGPDSSFTRASSDQASVYSNDSRSRASNNFSPQNSSQSTSSANSKDKGKGKEKAEEGSTSYNILRHQRGKESHCFVAKK